MTKKNLTALLNTPPSSSSLKDKQGFQYIPVGVVENMLDEFFGVGGWQTTNFQWSIIDKELVGSIVLSVFINGVWVSRYGAAATAVRHYSALHKNAGQKIPKTLEMDLPHLLSCCLTNAAKKLGKAFGRDLNRDHVSQFDAEKTEILSSNDNKPWFRSTSPRFPAAIESLKKGTTTVEAILATYQVTAADLETLKKAEGEYNG